MENQAVCSLKMAFTRIVLDLMTSSWINAIIGTRQAKKNNIPITTFMIASDPYLQTFVKKFSEVNNGKAFYTGLDGLSEMIFEDYDKNRRQKLR